MSETTTRGRTWFGRRRDPARPRRKAPWWELPALVVAAVLVAIVVKSFVVQPFYIPSQSMEKTLHGCPGCRGDRILVNKTIYDFPRPAPPATSWCSTLRPAGDDEPASHPAGQERGAAGDPRVRPADRVRAAGRRDPRQAGDRRRRADDQGQRRRRRVRQKPGRAVSQAGRAVRLHPGPVRPAAGVRAGHRAEGPALGDGRPPHPTRRTRAGTAPRAVSRTTATPRSAPSSCARPRCRSAT